MKVFISWSGLTSHKVATVLRDWVPSVIQTVVPYLSSEDIDKGARWSTDIAGELNQSAFGILCVTKDNVDAAWLNFEAGALGKSVDKSRVCPFLFRIKRSEISGPILQFQSTICEKDDVLKLLKSINSSCEKTIEEARLEKAFEVWWPSLKKELDAIEEENPPAEQTEKKHVSATAQMEKILEEVLELSRLNQKILRSPEELLPPGYLAKLLLPNRGRDPEMPDLVEHPVFDDLLESFVHFSQSFREFAEMHRKLAGLGELNAAFMDFRKPVEYIVRKYGMRTRRVSPRVLSEFSGKL